MTILNHSTSTTKKNRNNIGFKYYILGIFFLNKPVIECIFKQGLVKTCLYINRDTSTFHTVKKNDVNLVRSSPVCQFFLIKRGHIE